MNKIFNPDNIFILILVSISIYVPWQISTGIKKVYWGYDFLWSAPSGVIDSVQYNSTVYFELIALEIVIAMVSVYGFTYVRSIVIKTYSWIKNSARN